MCSNKLFALTVLAAGTAFATSRTVTDGAEFAAAIAELNDSANNEIVLAGSDFDMSEYGDDSTCVKASKLTIRGAADDPRGTVVYCNGTKRIFTLSSGAKLSNLTVSNGCATAEGGGIKVWDTASRGEHLVVTCCRSDAGGGGAYGGIWTDCIFAGNSSGANGGGLLNGEIHGCTVSNNTATSYGAGFSGTKAYDSAIVCNTNLNSFGGGSFRGTASNCLYFANCALGGGGAYETTFQRSQIISNVATKSAGGLCGRTARGCRIAFNLVKGGSASDDLRGGGIADANVYDSLIEGNAIGSGAGKNRLGGGGAATAFSNCVIRNNFVYQGTSGVNSGAGLNGGSAIDCVVSNNAGSATVRLASLLLGCTVVGPVDSVDSMVNSRLVDYKESTFLNPGDNVFGQGSLNYASLISGPMACTNCLIAGNKVKSSCRFLYAPGAGKQQVFSNCTIVDNYTDNMFVNFSSGNGSAVFHNCIFSPNYLTYDGRRRDVNFSGVSTDGISLRNCLIGTNRSGGKPAGGETGTVTADDAGFDADCVSDPYSLKRRSPARGTGEVEGWMATATDIRGGGYGRLRDGNVDIGAYQCWIYPNGLLMVVR